MYKNFKSLVFLTQLIFSNYLLASTLSSKIIEINNFKDVLKYTTKDSLVLVDIDNTLLTTAQTIGSDQWFEYLVKNNIKNGLSRYDSREQAFSSWRYVQTYSKVKLIELDTPNILRNIQDNIGHVFVLTARSGTIHELSVKQLNSLSMDFSYNRKNGQAIYNKGIISSERADKGGAFLNFLKLSNLDLNKINNIIFIDDKFRNLEAIKKTVSSIGKSYIGLRYAGADDEVKSFSSQLADKQYSILKTCASLLPDQLVLTIKNTNNCSQFLSYKIH